MTRDPNEYWKLIQSHRIPILKTIALFCILAIAAFFVLPKRYKATAAIAIQTEYFQLPLVSGFLPETMDPQELRAKREALIRRALDQRFVTEIARRYHLVKDSELESANNYEIELLRKKFEIIPNGTSAFLVSFSSRDPEVTYQVLRELLTRLKDLMTSERYTTLLNLHDAIQAQLEALSAGKTSESSDAILAARPDLVRRRIDSVQRQIDALASSYSEKHPRVAALQAQLVRLQRIVEITPENSAPPERPDLFAGVKVDEGSKELFDDLMRKYRYIDVVMYMDLQSRDRYLSYLDEPFVPQSPTWPKLPILLTWAIASGFFVGALTVLIKSRRQLLRTSTTPPTSLAIAGQKAYVQMDGNV